MYLGVIENYIHQLTDTGLGIVEAMLRAERHKRAQYNRVRATLCCDDLPEEFIDGYLAAERRLRPA